MKIAADFDVNSRKRPELPVNEVLYRVISERREELPFTLCVQDIQEILPHGETKIYELLNTGEIPARKVEGKWVIPTDLFLAWLYGDEEKSRPI